MPIVKLYGNLRKAAAVPRSAIHISADSVQALLEALCGRFPELCPALLDQGVLRPHIRVIVNGHDIELAQGLATPLQPQDQVSIFPPIAGGFS